MEVGPGRVADALRGLDHVDITSPGGRLLGAAHHARGAAGGPRAVRPRVRRLVPAPRGPGRRRRREVDPRTMHKSARADPPRPARWAARRRPPRASRTSIGHSAHEVLREQGLRGDDAGGVRRRAQADRPSSRSRRPTRRSHRLRRDRARRASSTCGRLARDAHRDRRATRSAAAIAGARETPRKLVVLCDVSGSMEAYSRALLLYLHAILRLGRGAEVFAFGTRLTRLTRELQTRDPDLALRARRRPRRRLGGGHADRRVAEGVQRRLGAARADARRGRAHRLRRLGARRPRARRPRDGAPAPRGVRGRVGEPGQGQPRLPAAGRGGMRAALPSIDRFVAGHNLASLEALGRAAGRDRATPRRLTPAARVTFAPRRSGIDNRAEG